MFFEPGFLGTRAAMYMDVVTVYFAVLPFLVAFAIRYAVRGEYEKHYRSQVLTLALTLVVVVVFEVGVRIGGGFLEYAKASGMNYGFMVAFLIVHILVAMVTVGAWVFQIVTARYAYLEQGPSAEHFALHKKRGRRVFAGIALTSVMGVMIYLFLFVM
jgi:putative membrane protein